MATATIRTSTMDSTPSKKTTNGKAKTIGTIRTRDVAMALN